MISLITIPMISNINLISIYYAFILFSYFILYLLFYIIIIYLYFVKIILVEYLYVIVNLHILLYFNLLGREFMSICILTFLRIEVNYRLICKYLIMVRLGLIVILCSFSFRCRIFYLPFSICTSIRRGLRCWSLYNGLRFISNVGYCWLRLCGIRFSKFLLNIWIKYLIYYQFNDN